MSPLRPGKWLSAAARRTRSPDCASRLGREIGAPEGDLDPLNGPQRGHRRFPQRLVLREPLTRGFVQIDVRVGCRQDVRARPERRLEHVLQRRRDRLADDAPTANLFGDLGHAVIGAQPDHVVARTDAGVEVLEQRADRPIEPDEHVLNFMAARTVDVADPVSGREADAEKVRRRALAELQRIDRRRGHPAEILVGVRRALPAGVVVRIDFSAGDGERMRERRRPAHDLALARHRVLALIRRAAAASAPRPCRSRR